MSKRVTKWRDLLPLHPAAELFPMMSESELRELGEDIKEQKLHEPIALWFPDPESNKPELLDGRNRMDAMEAAGISVVRDEWKGGGIHQLLVSWSGVYAPADPYAYVISRNIHRRHLTAEQRRELIAKLLKANPDHSNRQIAETIKASHVTVGAVRAELEGRGQIDHVEARTDTKGRQQPAHKARTEPTGGATGSIRRRRPIGARAEALADEQSQNTAGNDPNAFISAALRAIEQQISEIGRRQPKAAEKFPAADRHIVHGAETKRHERVAQRFRGGVGEPRMSASLSWWDRTFNPWIGCTKVSDACLKCYAETENRFRRWVTGWGAGIPRHRTCAGYWRQALIWNRQAAETGYRPRVFCASLADVLDNEVEDAWRSDLWQLIRETPLLRWMLVTKRIGNATKMLPADWPLPNAGLIATLEGQEVWSRKFPKLMAVPAVWRGVSAEPLLGPIDIGDARPDWLITGGESGKAARYTDPAWIRSLRDQCARNGIAFHFKQWGGTRPSNSGCLLDGREHKEFPAALIGETPATLEAAHGRNKMESLAAEANQRPAQSQE